MPGDPQQLRYSLEIMPSDPRRKTGVQLHVVCVPVGTVVGFAMVVGCRYCLPGWSCVLGTLKCVDRKTESCFGVLSAWPALRVCCCCSLIRLSALSGGARTSDISISSTGAFNCGSFVNDFQIPCVILLSSRFAARRVLCRLWFGPPRGAVAISC